MNGQHPSERNSTDPERIVRNGYDYHRTDHTVDATISFREVTMDRDLERLHEWCGYDHVKPFWQLDLPLPEFRERLAEKLADDHLTPYIGYVDHVPMSYWEVYWAAEDDLAQYYDARSGDRGAHVLFGPEEFVGRGYAIPFVRALGLWQFSHPATDRAVLEPDARNEVIIHVLQQCGFELREEFSFEEEEKTAALMLCSQERFEATLLDDGEEVPRRGIADD